MDTPSGWSILTSISSMIVVWFDLIKSALASLAWPATVLTALLVFRKDIVALLSKLASFKLAGAEAMFSHGVHQLDPLGSAEEAKADAAANVAAAAAEAEAEAAQAKDHNEGQVAHGDDAATPPTEPRDGAGNARNTDPVTENVNDKPAIRSKLLFDAFHRDAGINDGSSTGITLSTWISSFRDYLLKSSLDGTAAKDLDEARLIAANSPSGAVLLAWRAIEGVLQQIPVQLDLGTSPSSAAKHGWKNPSTIMRHLIRESHIDTETYERFYDLQKLRNSVAHASRFTAAPADVLEYIDRAEELATTLTSVVTRLAMKKPPTPNPQAAP